MYAVTDGNFLKGKSIAGQGEDFAEEPVSCTLRGSRVIRDCRLTYYMGWVCGY